MVVAMKPSGDMTSYNPLQRIVVVVMVIVAGVATVMELI